MIKKLALTVLFVLGCALTTHAQTIDPYGGDVAIPCSSWTNSYFGLLKISTKWYFCTPVTTAGQGGATVPANSTSHAFIAESVGNTTLNNNVLDCASVNTNPLFVTKYGGTGNGDPYNEAWQILKRMEHWGFNSVGQDSSAQVYPYDTCNSCVWPGTNPKKQPIPVPYIDERRPAEDAGTNANGFLAQAVHDVMSGLNANFSGYRGGSAFDLFDPNVKTQFTDEITRSDIGDLNIVNNYPFLLGLFTDDSDWFFGSGAGPDFPSQPSGHTNTNLGWMTLIASPVQTFLLNTTASPHPAELYSSNQNVIVKNQATNPAHGTCSISNPCSLRDWLYDKYSGSIAALNTAWGSSYTTFDSSGTQVTGETPGSCTNSCSGNGTTTVFTMTLAHTPVSPLSVLFFVGGTAKAGDCPWFHDTGSGSTTTCKQGGSTLATNTGTLGSPTANYLTGASSTINYSTGAVTLTFVTAPASGAAITVNYIYGGWMAGGTGLMDEDGAAGGTTHNSSTWVGTNQYCVEGADSNYPTYFTCVAGQNGVPNANANLGADLDTWISQYAAAYFKPLQAALRATGSKIPYFGLDTIGSWGVPSYSKFLAGAAPYVDGEFIQLYEDSTVPADAVAYQYQTRYGGDIPLMNFFTLTAEADSAESCHTMPIGGGNFATQAQRGQFYYNTVNYLLTTTGFNGTIPFVGFDWWSWIDFANANQGLVSVHDNAYNPIEASSSSVACDSYYTVLGGATCGSESTTYGDAITLITSGNAIWLGGAPPPTFPIAPSVKSIIWALGSAPVEDPLGIKNLGFESDGTRRLNLFDRRPDAEPFHAVKAGRLQSKFAFDEALESHSGEQFPAPIGRANREGYDGSGLGGAHHLFQVGSEAGKVRKVLKNAVGEHEVSGLVGNVRERAVIRQTEFYVREGLLFGDFEHLVGQVKCNDVPNFFSDCSSDSANPTADFNDSAAWMKTRRALDTVPNRQAGPPEVVQVAPFVGAIR